LKNTSSVHTTVFPYEDGLFTLFERWLPLLLLALPTLIYSWRDGYFADAALMPRALMARTDVYYAITL